jgi:DNA-binding XRE family transcriptional regulator
MFKSILAVSVTHSVLSIKLMFMAKKLDGLTQAEVREIKVQLKQIGSTLQEARLKSKLTQEALAETIDVSVNTIKYIEQGRRVPSLQMLLRICKKVGIKLELNSDL